MKNLQTLPTANEEWGFHGTSKQNGYDVSLTWPVTSQFIAKEFDLNPTQTRDVLDSKFGRHLADDYSFIINGKGNAAGPISEAAIKRHLQDRVSDKGWRDCFENAIRENTDKVIVKKKPLTKDELFTEIAQRYLHIETLVERKMDRLDFHDVAVWGVKAALEAAFTAGQKSNNKLGA